MQDYGNCEIVNQKQKHITLREKTFGKEILTEGVFVEFLSIIYKSFFRNNEKNDTSSKKPYNFPRKHTEIEHNSQKFILQNTGFLGYKLNRESLGMKDCITKQCKSYLYLRSVRNYSVLQTVILLEIVELISGNRPAYYEENNLLVRLWALYRIF